MFFMTFMTDSSGTDGLEYLIYRLFTIFLSNSVGRNPGPPWILCELVRLAEPIEPTEPPPRYTPFATALHFSCASWHMGKGCSHSFCRATACNDKVLSCPRLSSLIDPCIRFIHKVHRLSSFIPSPHREYGASATLERMTAPSSRTWTTTTEGTTAFACPCAIGASLPRTYILTHTRIHLSPPPSAHALLLSISSHYLPPYFTDL